MQEEGGKAQAPLILALPLGWILRVLTLGSHPCCLAQA